MTKLISHHMTRSRIFLSKRSNDSHDGQIFHIRSEHLSKILVKKNRNILCTFEKKKFVSRNLRLHEIYLENITQIGWPKCTILYQGGSIQTYTNEKDVSTTNFICLRQTCYSASKCQGFGNATKLQVYLQLKCQLYIV